MLNLSGITVRLGGHTILDGATAALPPGSRVGLVGRNGAGKSTLMRVVAGSIDPEEGSVDMPRAARVGYIAQDAPAGDATPFETVLAADVEREALLREEEATDDGHRIAEIHERLNAIDAHAAPARAARILVGLGFDEGMQQQPLDSFSGGWRMRVALAALLFSQPDLLLLDEPSNHLDLESTLWLENFLKGYKATMLIVSHERDLLNNVVDHILHLKQGKTTLYPGGYDSFEKQVAERMAVLEAARAAQAGQRARLQDYIARNSARASTARQAQSRAKALAKMKPIAEVANDPSLSFDFPSPAKLRPPLMTLDMASVGYTPGLPILTRLNLRIDPEDRIALLGRNGNGKTTLARLLSAQLMPMEGGMTAPGKLKVGYFTQYQVEELEGDSSPLEHMSRLMKGATPAAVRAQLGRFGFSGDKATRAVGTMSGGERARLALALVTRDAPHMLILDEPTNHLDVDAREALVQALNDYGGTVILVSHDRHMIELTADRLVLVDHGTAVEYGGSLDDYTDMILGRNGAGVGGGGAGDAPGAAPKVSRKDERRAAADAREKTKTLRAAAKAAEAELARLEARRTEIDRAMFDPASATAADAKLTMSALMKLRAEVQASIEAAEARWMEASAQLEEAGLAA
jgi:ATP-binding cassette subfamily F protein 3